jgi:hypothetical protein
MTHASFISALIGNVRDRGAAAALDELDATRPLIAGRPYGHTTAAFYVWAVDRLIDAGLSDVGVLWHPLVDARSIEAWYPEEVLAGDAARAGFVPSPLALFGEPQPTEPRLLAAGR